MILKIVVTALAIICTIALLLVFVRHLKQTRRIIVVSDISQSDQVIGDGAWITPANYPSRIRNVEPRGA